MPWVLNLTLVMHPFTVIAKDHHSHKVSPESQPSKGQPKNHQRAELKTIETSKIVVKVKGMVCAFCAQGIGKNFENQDEVKTTNVDLDTKEVTIEFKKGKSLPLARIKALVEDAGFSLDTASAEGSPRK